MAKDLANLYQYLKGENMDIMTDLTVPVTIISIIPSLSRSLSYSSKQTSGINMPLASLTSILENTKKVIMSIAELSVPSTIYDSVKEKINTLFNKLSIQINSKERLIQSLLVIISIVSIQILRIYLTNKEKGKELLSKFELNINTVKNLMGKKVFKNIDTIFDIPINYVKHIIDQRGGNQTEVINMSKPIDENLLFDFRKCDNSSACFDMVTKLSKQYDNLSCSDKIKTILRTNPENSKKVLSQLGYSTETGWSNSPYKTSIINDKILENFLFLIKEHAYNVPQTGGNNDIRIYDMLRNLQRIKINQPVIVIGIPLYKQISNISLLNPYTDSSLLLTLINQIKKELSYGDIKMDSNTEATLNKNILLYKTIDLELKEKMIDVYEHEMIYNFMDEQYISDLNEINELVMKKNKLAEKLINNAMCMLNVCVSD